MLDVIKSYLVALGFQVNQGEFNKAQGAINDLGRTVQTVTTGMSKNFAVAATGVAAALTTINAATAGLVTQIAAADMQYQKFALRLWTTKETAKDLQSTLRAMGEEMEDVAWIPELRQQYAELIQQGRQMKTPLEADDQLKHVRSIMFEFKRIKLEVQYASEWVSYYLLKYFGGPLASIKAQLSEFNDKLIKTMPEWTKTIAQMLATFMNFGIATGRFIKDLYDGFTAFFDMIPRGAKIALAAIMGVWAVLRLNPVGQIMIAISAALVLLEDFYGYIDGRKSSKTLAPIWQKLIDWFNQAKPLAADFAAIITEAWDKLTQKIESVSEVQQKYWNIIKNSGAVKAVLKVFLSMWEYLKEIVAAVSDAVGWLFDGMVDLFNYLAEDGAVEAGLELFSTLWETVSNLILGFVNVSRNVRQFWKDAAGTQAARTMWDWFKGTISFVVKMVAMLGKSFLGLFDMIGLGLQGKFAEAAERGKKIFRDFQRDFEGLGKGGTFESLVNAISGQESGGDYNAVNDRTGAKGKYQIMPENWEPWAREAGLPAGSPMTPENQDYVAKFKLRQYYDKYGARGAAIAWYAGEGALNYSAEELSRKQGNGDEPSIDEYASSVTGRMSASANNARPVSYPGSLPVASALPTYAQAAAPSSSNYSNAVTIQVGDINIMQPNATPTQVRDSVADGIQQGQRRVSPQFRELKGVLV